MLLIKCVVSLSRLVLNRLKPQRLNTMKFSPTNMARREINSCIDLRIMVKEKLPCDMTRPSPSLASSRNIKTTCLLFLNAIKSNPCGEQKTHSEADIGNFCNVTLTLLGLIHRLQTQKFWHWFTMHTMHWD